MSTTQDRRSIRAEAGRFAARWIARHPSMKSRIDRALDLVDGVVPLAEGVWQVPSSSGDAPYIVTSSPSARMSDCPCADSVFAGRKCKHRLAAGLVYRVHQSI